MEKHPKSPWRAALLTDLGLEYYNAAYYSRALKAWEEGWSLAKDAPDLGGKLLGDRAVCELAGLYARLGRVPELERLLKSVERRPFVGGATERISVAREALYTMKHRPEISFRCGPLALQSVNRALNPNALLPMEIFNSASTTQGFSLVQVADLSRKVGLNYQMAFRDKGAEFVLPSVVHWKVGHYAALVRQGGGRFLVEDPTFVNTVWATPGALEAETSGYFLIPPGPLPKGWRAATVEECAAVWGKGYASSIDANNYTPSDLMTCSADEAIEDPEAMVSRSLAPPPPMAVARVHYGLANLQVRDTPVGYAPPVGPPVRFTLRYNHRDYVIPAASDNSPMGSKWTHDWNGSITDIANNPLADVTYKVAGGGVRYFTGFDTNTQTFAPQQFDQTILKRIGTNVATSTYEMLYPNGAKKIFGRIGGAATLTRLVDPSGNAITLSWANSRLISITDAIGQVTTFSYGHLTNSSLITRVTDPFGRFATFEYAVYSVDTDNNPNTPKVDFFILNKITDVAGLTSQFTYQQGDFTWDIMAQMTTPYGTTAFNVSPGTTADAGTRYVETTYPDGSKDRVEFNQDGNLGTPLSEPSASIPQGMSTLNGYLIYRNTYYWDRKAYASGRGDFTKARLFHWLHTPNIATMGGILESTKAPLEGRVWYDYAGQSSPAIVGSSDRPTHVGRVLDDGSTQLHSYQYNGLGRLTNSIDPAGRKFSYLYASNGVDLLEARQTRGTNNELLTAVTYDSQHRPLTIKDAAGQTSVNTYNARGQLLTTSNPKGETATFTYNANGYLLKADGPLPGTNDVLTFTYDSNGRVRTRTDMSGHTLTLDYDVLDRPTRVTYPDATYNDFTYNRLDMVQRRDRAGRVTTMEYDSLRQLAKVIDPVNRTTLLQWCGCGGLESLTDPLGRKTSWETDVQGRPVRKKYADGSQILYQYETRTSRVQQIVDEKLQLTQFSYNRDETLNAIAYTNTAVPTPAVRYGYDPDYRRVTSMVDGIGTNFYTYHPFGSLGAGKLATEDGPWANDTITYQYDELQRMTNRDIAGAQESWSFDSFGRINSYANVQGVIGLSFDGPTRRLSGVTYPSGQTSQLEYFSTAGDHRLQRITHRKADTSQLSRFTYAYDPVGNITNWVQELSSITETWGAQHDGSDRLTDVAVNQGGTNSFTIGHTYDAADNRLVENVAGNPVQSQFNALNQQVASASAITNATYEWDGQHRLRAIVRGPNRTEFTYDGRGRLRILTEKQGGTTVNERRFLWCNLKIRQERDTNNLVVNRFFARGEQRGGTNLFYFSDHLGSPRELTDASSTIRAEYAYSPFGVRRKLAGNLDSTFGFTGLLNHEPTETLFAVHRAYSPRSARWLSRDPIGERGGLNLYGYVRQNPLNRIDPLGLDEVNQESEDAKADLWKLTQGTSFVLDIGSRIDEFGHIPVFTPVFTVLDIFLSMRSFYIMAEDPTAKNIFTATSSCLETALAIGIPEIGIPIKVIHQLYSWGVFDTHEMDSPGMIEAVSRLDEDPLAIYNEHKF